MLCLRTLRKRVVSTAGGTSHYVTYVRAAARLGRPHRIASVRSASTVVVAPKSVAYWLFGVSGMVAGMVTVGGITRLTKSGLSMTDWKLHGNMYPVTDEEWQREFDRYKTFPEWQQRQSMTINEFKYIFFWEYAHRMMGRTVGVAFALPGMYFAARGMIPRSLYPRLGLLFALGGGQGLIGWWMVKSGLEMSPEQKKEIRVSPYRLATHLSMAFTTYVLLLWTGLDVLSRTCDRPQQQQQRLKTLSADAIRYAKRLRGMSGVSAGLVALTVLSGAYVAGNDAGRAYNTFPTMDGEWIPSEILDMQPLWRNFFENTATVQFDHRVLAMTTLSSIAALYGAALTGTGVTSSSEATQAQQQTKGKLVNMLPKTSRKLLHLSAGMGITQVALGISTLLLYVPVELAAIHQAGSLVLMSFITALVHSLRFVKYTPAAAVTTTAAATAATAGGSTVSRSYGSAVLRAGANGGAAKRGYTTAAISTAVSRHGHGFHRSLSKYHHPRPAAAATNITRTTACHR